MKKRQAATNLHFLRRKAKSFSTWRLPQPSGSNIHLSHSMVNGKALSGEWWSGSGGGRWGGRSLTLRALCLPYPAHLSPVVTVVLPRMPVARVLWQREALGGEGRQAGSDQGRPQTVWLMPTTFAAHLFLQMLKKRLLCLLSHLSTDFRNSACRRNSPLHTPCLCSRKFSAAATSSEKKPPPC